MGAKAKPGGRRAAIIIGLTGLALVGAAAFIERDGIAEAWFIWRLGSADDGVRSRAAARLGAMRSTAAVPDLVRAILADPRENVEFDTLPDGRTLLALTPFAHAVHAAGPCDHFSTMMVKVWYLFPGQDSARLERVLKAIEESWEKSWEIVRKEKPPVGQGKP